MRKYSRKKITLGQVSGAALSTSTKRTPDEIDAEVERLKRSGWVDRKAPPEVPELEGAMTYTVFTGQGHKPKTGGRGTPKRPDKSRDIVVIKRSKADGERRGMIFTDRNGNAD